MLRRLPLPRILGTLEAIYGRALAKHGVSWVHTAAGIVWKLDLRDSSQRWIVFGNYEGKRQMDWIHHWLRPGGTIIDSGANVGQLLLYLGRLPNVRIHAFEPVPASVAWLHECLAAQNAWPVNIIESALSDREGTLRIQVDGAYSTTQMGWYQERGNPRIDVRSMRLDDYIEEQGVKQIRFWKLDVEGGEAQALAGAQRLLAQQRIDAILVETSSETGEDIRKQLSDDGYSAMRIGPRQSLIPDYSVIETLRNSVFIRPGLDS